MSYLIMPVMGMDNVRPDEALQVTGDSGRLHVREAVNVNVSEAGKVSLRNGSRHVTGTKYESLWQSPLHKDVFGVLGGDLVKVNTADWSHEVIGRVGRNVRYCLLNNKVCISSTFGLMLFDGVQLRPLTIETPPVPKAITGTQGALKVGKYTIGISWVGDVESAASESTTVEITGTVDSFDTYASGSIVVELPTVYDTSVKAVRVYVSSRDGTQLMQYGEYDSATTTVEITNVETVTAPMKFSHMTPMPAGDYLRLWKGRLIVASRNIIRFSEPLAYHIHDARYGYVAMPQRVTFIEPVEGGVWVGQGTHVVFLRGTSPSEFAFELGSNIAPVPNSSILVESDVTNDASQGGRWCAMWLSERGYMIGTAEGQMLEYQSKNLQGITGNDSRTVRIDERVITIVS